MKGDVDGLTVAIVGATGGIGQHVVYFAAQRGFSVVALARRPENVKAGPQVEARRYDVLDPSTVGPAFEGVDVVVSCLGKGLFSPQVVHDGTAQALKACPDLSKIIAVSSVGVGSSWDQCVRISWLFAWVIRPLMLRSAFKDLGRMEALLEGHPTTSVVVRPVGLTGGGGAPARGYSHTDDVPEMVSRRAVAKFMVDLIEDPSWDNQAVTVAPG